MHAARSRMSYVTRLGWIDSASIEYSRLNAEAMSSTYSEEETIPSAEVMRAMGRGASPMRSRCG